jgi:hypothetical protein
MLGAIGVVNPSYPPNPAALDELTMDLRLFHRQAGFFLNNHHCAMRAFLDGTSLNGTGVMECIGTNPPTFFSETFSLIFVPACGA